MDIFGTILMGIIAIIIYYWKDCQVIEAKSNYALEKIKTDALINILKVHGIIAEIKEDE